MAHTPRTVTVLAVLGTVVLLGTAGAAVGGATDASRPDRPTVVTESPTHDAPIKLRRVSERDLARP